MRARFKQYRTEALARSRANEIRLRRELALAQEHIQILNEKLSMYQDHAQTHLVNVRQQLLVNVVRSFDNLAAMIDSLKFPPDPWERRRLEEQALSLAASQQQQQQQQSKQPQ